jgi:hypothetical protein
MPRISQSEARALARKSPYYEGWFYQRGGRVAGGGYNTLVQCWLSTRCRGAWTSVLEEPGFVLVTFFDRNDFETAATAFGPTKPINSMGAKAAFEFPR